MNDTALSNKTRIETRLRAAIPSLAQAPANAEVSRAFERVIRPLLAELGVTCDLVELYTITKKIEHREVANVHYIVFDHALLECFSVLDGLSDEKAPASRAALAMSRLFAEACRAGNQGLFYAFYILRAAKIAPLLARAAPWKRFEAHRRWQTVFLLGHEAAHALPASHRVRLALAEAAAISASDLMTGLIQGLTSELFEFLGSDEFARRANADLEVWRGVKEEMQIDDDTIFAAFEKVATDPRFLAEIACDIFAITAVERDLQLAPVPSKDAFVHAYRAFLHLRLLTYVGEVAANVDKLLDATRIEPFRLVLLVEAVFRGNLFVRRLLIVAESWETSEAFEHLKSELARVQSEHTSRLFEIANSVVEHELLDAQFRQAIANTVSAEGLDPKRMDDDLLDTIDDLDAVWFKQLPHR